VSAPGTPTPTPAPAAPPARPWWVPLLGVGSVGLGGLQALGGLLMCAVALSAPVGARAGFLLAGVAWLVPGLLLGLSGVAVTAGWSSARGLCLAAVAAAALGIGTFAAARRSVPPAVAEAGEWMLTHPEFTPEARDTVRDLFRRFSGAGERIEPLDAVRALRDPEIGESAARWYAGYCCCPVLPWYLLVLLAAVRRGRFCSLASGGAAPPSR